MSGDEYHYAACHDCPLYKFTDTRSGAEGAAARHHDERGHDSVWGTVHPNVINDLEPEPTEPYNNAEEDDLKTDGGRVHHDSRTCGDCQLARETDGGVR